MRVISVASSRAQRRAALHRRSCAQLAAHRFNLQLVAAAITHDGRTGRPTAARNPRRQRASPSSRRAVLRSSPTVMLQRRQAALDRLDPLVQADWIAVANAVERRQQFLLKIAQHIRNNNRIRRYAFSDVRLGRCHARPSVVHCPYDLMRRAVGSGLSVCRALVGVLMLDLFRRIDNQRPDRVYRHVHRTAVVQSPDSRLGARRSRGSDPRFASAVYNGLLSGEALITVSLETTARSPCRMPRRLPQTMDRTVAGMPQCTG